MRKFYSDPDFGCRRARAECLFQHVKTCCADGAAHVALA